jgi:hypothetical protein
MSTHAKLVLHSLVLAGLLAITAYVHHAVNEITNTFVAVREADAKFFAKLIQDNWGGISTVPNEKKEILLRNLDPEIAGTDLRAMRSLLLFVFYPFMITIVIQIVVSAVKLRRSRNVGTAL